VLHSGNSAASQNLQVVTELQVAEALLLLPGATSEVLLPAAAPMPLAKVSPVVSRTSSTALASAPSTPVTGRVSFADTTPFNAMQQVSCQPWTNILAS
jgi:hypothetical protein